MRLGIAYYCHDIEFSHGLLERFPQYEVVHILVPGGQSIVWLNTLCCRSFDVKTWIGQRKSNKILINSLFVCTIISNRSNEFHNGKNQQQQQELEGNELTTTYQRLGNFITNVRFFK